MTASQFLSRRRQRNLLYKLGGFLLCAILCFLIIDAGHPVLGAGIVVIAALAMQFALSYARALLCPACGGDYHPFSCTDRRERIGGRSCTAPIVAAIWTR